MALLSIELVRARILGPLTALQEFETSLWYVTRKDIDAQLAIGESRRDPQIRNVRAEIPHPSGQ
jgi:hypothetical protein